jgi:hypothetical protein
MAYNLSAFAGAGAQFFDSNGVPLAGGLLYVYTAGTTTPATTWTTNAGDVANTNPIVLNAAGRTPYEIWLNSGVTYKFALYTSTNVLIGTYDNIPAIDDPTVFNNLITVTGTNALIGTSVPPYTSYVAGMTLSFIPVTTNTGAVTIDVDGLGAKNIFVGNASALAAGDLVAGRFAYVEYDGTRFQLFTSSIADSAVTTAKIANGAVTPSKLSTGAPVWDTSNNLGIGVAPNPAYRLNVSGSISMQGAGDRFYQVNNSGVTVAELGIGVFTGSADSIGLNNKTLTGSISFGVNSSSLMTIENDGQQKSVIPGGTTTYPEYKCRAWVNFNGTGTVAIRASGNVSSITDNGTGDYTVNFSTAMPDANYLPIPMQTDGDTSGDIRNMTGVVSYTTSACRFITYQVVSATSAQILKTDNAVCGLSIFR